MQAWEGDHVESKFAKIGIELAREAEACGDTGHGDRDEMVKITIGRVRELQRTEADIIKSFIVDTEGFVSVFDELMDRKSGVVGFYNCVRDL